MPAAPVGGSDWMEQKGLLAQPKNRNAGLLGEAVGGVLPIVAAAKAPQIAKGLLQMGENAAKPSTLRNVSQRGIFGGELAQTADKAALAKAKALEGSGADQRAIWKETGWFKGGDGKWRFEIDDSAAAIRDTALPTTSIGGKQYADFPISAAVDHKDLFSAYPDAKKIGGSFEEGFGVGGTYRGLDHIQFGGGYRADAFTPADAAARRALDAESLALTNSTRGRRYEAITDALLERNGGNFTDPRLVKIIEKYGGPIEAKRIAIGEAKDAIAPSGIGLSKDARSVALHELQHAIQGREGFAVGGSPESMRQEALAMLRRDVASGAIPDTAEAMRMLPMAQQNAYQRLAGEAEARAVQARMNLTPAQRRALFPLDSYDVPLNSLIYKHE